MKNTLKNIVDAFVSNASNRMHAIGTFAFSLALTLGLALGATAETIDSPKLVEYTFDYTNATIVVQTNEYPVSGMVDNKAMLIAANDLIIELRPNEGYAFGKVDGWVSMEGGIVSNGVVQATDQTLVLPRPALIDVTFEVPVGEHVTAVVSNLTAGGAAMVTNNLGKYIATYFDYVKASYSADEGCVLVNGDDQVNQITNGVEFTKVIATKLPPVSYQSPVYKTPGDPTSGVASWETLTTNLYTVVTSETATVTWNAGWYVVTNEVNLSKGAQCNGAVNLILADGAKLTAQGGNSKAGIGVMGKWSLTIYAQTAGTGQLVAQGGFNSAGIGGDCDMPGKNITINGGTVTAKGDGSGAGIGGGKCGSGQNIRINGGTVKATAGQDCNNAIGDGAAD